MIKSAMSIKLNIRPLLGILVHSDFWEGPCRGGIREEMSHEAEMAAAKRKFDHVRTQLAGLTEDAKLMEPIFVPYDEQFLVDESIVAEINSQISDTDVLLILNQRIPKIERFGRPIISYTHAVSAADSCAYLRSIGMEAFYAIDMPELNALIHRLWVRKAMQNTRALILTAGETPTWGLLSNIRDVEGLRTRYGVEIIRKPFTDIFKYMDEVSDEEASLLTDELYNNSKENKVRKDYLINDVKYYLAVKRMMELYACNAFSTSCVELCRSRIPQERKFTPCICHTLLKDIGIPSACEEDLNALMAMMIMMYLGKRPAFMGNPLYETDEIISIHHSVPCLKMNGFDSKELEYSIYPFTGQGFGGKIQIDFAQNNSDAVSFGRFDPTGRKMLLNTGKVLKSKYTEAYCSPYYFLQVGDSRKILHSMMDFGHHQALIFGNWCKELRELAKLLGFELVEP